MMSMSSNMKYKNANGSQFSGMNSISDLPFPLTLNCRMMQDDESLLFPSSHLHTVGHTADQ